MQLKNLKKYCFTGMIDFLKVLRLSYPVSSLSPASLCSRKHKKISCSRFALEKNFEPDLRASLQGCLPWVCKWVSETSVSHARFWPRKCRPAARLLNALETSRFNQEIASRTKSKDCRATYTLLAV